MQIYGLLLQVQTNKNIEKRINMLGKNWEIIEMYKDILIYKKNDTIHFGNKNFDSVRAKSILSAKNLITRHINKLSNKERNSLKYLKYEI